MIKLVTYVSFQDENTLMNAAKDLSRRKITIMDAFTPFPIHGLDEVLGQKRSRLPIVCFIAASAGCIFSMWFQVWTSAVDWPIIVGGKPMASIPAFIPVTFEVTVLLGGLITVAAFLLRSGLFPGKRSRVPHLSVTSDGFWLAVERETAKIADVALVETLESLGGKQIRTEERTV